MMELKIADIQKIIYNLKKNIVMFYFVNVIKLI